MEARNHPLGSPGNPAVIDDDETYTHADKGLKEACELYEFLQRLSPQKLPSSHLSSSTIGDKDQTLNRSSDEILKWSLASSSCPENKEHKSAKSVVLPPLGHANDRRDPPQESRIVSKRTQRFTSNPIVSRRSLSRSECSSLSLSALFLPKTRQEGQGQRLEDWFPSTPMIMSSSKRFPPLKKPNKLAARDHPDVTRPSKLPRYSMKLD